MQRGENRTGRGHLHRFRSVLPPLFLSRRFVVCVSVFPLSLRVIPMGESEETVVVKVVAAGGLLLGGVWVPEGDTAPLAKTRADQMVKDGHVERCPDGTEPDFPTLHPIPTPEQLEASRLAAEARANTPASELADWPHYIELNRAALRTLDDVKTFFEQNGSLSATKLALTDEQVVEIVAYGQKLEADAEAAAAAATKAAAKKTKPAAAAAPAADAPTT